MNEIFLKGQLKNITHSHNIGDIEFSQASLVCKRIDGTEDVVNLKFKTFSNKYKEDDIIELKGNLRSYSHKVEDNKNKVTLYVFTYFDPIEDEFESNNQVSIDGRICKLNDIRTTKNGKHNIHFILANNLTYDNGHKRLNSYIPCIAWGLIAKQIAKLKVNDKIKIEGELHSREHKKVHENGEIEFRVAHELHVKSFEVVE